MLETLEAKLIGLGVVLLLILAAFGGGFLWGNNHGYGNGYSQATDKMTKQVSEANASAASANAAVAKVNQQLKDNDAAAAAQAAAAESKVAAAQQAKLASDAQLAAWIDKYKHAVRTPAEQRLLSTPLPVDLQDY